jgi:hypothetical protein
MDLTSRKSYIYIFDHTEVSDQLAVHSILLGVPLVRRLKTQTNKSEKMIQWCNDRMKSEQVETTKVCKAETSWRSPWSSANERDNGALSEPFLGTWIQEERSWEQLKLCPMGWKSPHQAARLIPQDMTCAWHEHDMCHLKSLDQPCHAMFHAMFHRHPRSSPCHWARSVQRISGADVFEACHESHDVAWI